MKRFFGRDKPKPVKSPPGTKELANSNVLSAPPEDSHFYAQQQIPTQDRGSIRVSSDEHWDQLSSSDGNSPLLNPHSPRAVSPYSAPPVAPAVPPKAASIKDRDQQLLRKKPPAPQNAAAALGILRALDPHVDVPGLQREYSDEYSTEPSIRDDKKERKGFWERANERQKEREREKERQREKERKEDLDQNELTRMIGYLTATSSEDWSLVLEVCERASLNEANAREAMKALRKEFKYAEPGAQLSAARLWAIMLRNCSEVFIAQCSSRKFLDTLEDVLQAHKTSPVVRERLVEVLAGAAYASPHSKDGRDKEGFRGLWRKVKATEQPDEGIPFHTDDAMFNPPIPSYPPPPVIAEPPTAPPVRPSAGKHRSSRKQIISPEEDMRRLFEECKIGTGNAQLLSDSLTFAGPDDLKNNETIREFYARCRASQELIYAQIPWATAQAEKSRIAALEAAGRVSPRQEKRSRSATDPLPVQRSNSGEEPIISTREEDLLAALLATNEQIALVLAQYDDIERVGLERKVEDISKKETRIDRNRIYYDQDGQVHLEPPQPIWGGSSHSPSPATSPSPSPTPSVTVTRANTHHTNPFAPKPAPSPGYITNSYTHHTHVSSPSLAPPPPAPHGPRLPTQNSVARSRTPSPDRSSISHSNHHYDRYQDSVLHHATGRLRIADEDSLQYESDEEFREPVRPSAKALGKRRQVPLDESEAFDPDDLFYDHTNDSRRSENLSDDDSDEMHRPWQHHPVHYVYDAAAERRKERLKEAQRNVPAVAEVVH